MQYIICNLVYGYTPPSHHWITWCMRQHFPSFEYGGCQFKLNVFDYIRYSTCVGSEHRLWPCSSSIVQKDGSWPKLLCSGTSSMVACNKLLSKWNPTVSINHCMTLTMLPIKYELSHRLGNLLLLIFTSTLRKMLFLKRKCD